MPQLDASQLFCSFAAELIGTFYLVLTIGLNVVQNTPLAPLSIGLVLAVLICASGPISGGHFNPAVTLGVALAQRDKITAKGACANIVAQLFGGLLGAWCYSQVLGASFPLGPGSRYAWREVVAVEAIFSMALVFVVLNTATLNKSTQGAFYGEFAGFAIGLTVTAAAFAAGPISGCALNPAVAFGVLTVHGFRVGQATMLPVLYYTVSSLAGAAIAVGFFRLIREAEYAKLDKEPLPERQPLMSNRTISSRTSQGVSARGRTLETP